MNEKRLFSIEKEENVGFQWKKSVFDSIAGHFIQFAIT